MKNSVSWRESLNALLRNIAGNGSVHLSEIESDLLQINLLLMEAINKLGDNVVEMGQNVHHQQQIVIHLMESGNCSPFAVEKLEALGSSMDNNVASVVTAMQFQDMTSQLLDKVLMRLASLQQMAEEMEKLAADIVGAEGEGDVHMMIRAMGEELDSKRKELEGLHAQRVSQQHMESGSIELF